MLFENFFQYVNDLVLMKTCLLSNPRSKLLPETGSSMVKCIFCQEKEYVHILWSYPPTFHQHKEFHLLTTQISNWMICYCWLYPWMIDCPCTVVKHNISMSQVQHLIFNGLKLSCFYKYCFHLFQYPNFMNLHVFTI